MRAVSSYSWINIGSASTRLRPRRPQSRNAACQHTLLLLVVRYVGSYATATANYPPHAAHSTRATRRRLPPPSPPALAPAPERISWAILARLGGGDVHRRFPG